MATLTIRNLSEDTRRALKARAAGNNQSMEAEVRAILDAAVAPDTDFVSVWLAATEKLRGEFELPPRTPAREVDLRDRRRHQRVVRIVAASAGRASA